MGRLCGGMTLAFVLWREREREREREEERKINTEGKEARRERRNK